MIRRMARVALVAGTATAVSNSVARRQHGRWAEQSQQAATPVADSMTDTLAQLERLAELKERGILTDAEFEAQKQKLLGT